MTSHLMTFSSSVMRIPRPIESRECSGGRKRPRTKSAKSVSSLGLNSTSNSKRARTRTKTRTRTSLFLLAALALVWARAVPGSGWSVEAVQVGPEVIGEPEVERESSHEVERSGSVVGNEEEASNGKHKPATAPRPNPNPSDNPNANSNANANTNPRHYNGKLKLRRIRTRNAVVALQERERQRDSTNSGGSETVRNLEMLSSQSSSSSSSSSSSQSPLPWFRWTLTIPALAVELFPRGLALLALASLVVLEPVSSSTSAALAAAAAPRTAAVSAIGAGSTSVTATASTAAAATAATATSRVSSLPFTQWFPSLLIAPTTLSLPRLFGFGFDFDPGKLSSALQKTLPSVTAALLVAWLPGLLVQGAYWELGWLGLSLVSQWGFVRTEVLPSLLNNVIPQLVWGEFWKRTWEWMLLPLEEHAERNRGLLVPPPLSSSSSSLLRREAPSLAERFGAAWSKHVVSRIDKFAISSLKSVVQKPVQSSFGKWVPTIPMPTPTPTLTPTVSSSSSSSSSASSSSVEVYAVYEEEARSALRELPSSTSTSTSTSTTEKLAEPNDSCEALPTSPDQAEAVASS